MITIKIMLASQRNLRIVICACQVDNVRAWTTPNTVLQCLYTCRSRRNTVTVPEPPRSKTNLTLMRYNIRGYASNTMLPLYTIAPPVLNTMLERYKAAVLGPITQIRVIRALRYSRCANTCIMPCLKASLVPIFRTVEHHNRICQRRGIPYYDRLTPGRMKPQCNCIHVHIDPVPQNKTGHTLMQGTIKTLHRT